MSKSANDKKAVKKQPKKSVEEQEEEIMKAEMAKQNKLKPAEFIIDRIKWDSTLAKELEFFIIGYKDRFVGIMEINIPEFERCDTIPQHRIYYIKLYDQVIWDREKRIDLVSNNEVYKYSKNPATPVTPAQVTEDTVFEIKQGNNEDSNQQEEQQQDKSSGSEGDDDENGENGTGVVFPNRKNRKIYVAYTPEDTLEQTMLSINNRKLAVSKPTHVSQRGGCYHIDSKDMPQFYKTWAQSVSNNEKFWMEEERTKLFKCYVDIDIKLTDKTPYNIIEQGWIQMMSQITSEYFEQTHGIVVDTTCLVTECHSDWSDANTVSAKFKSGYRVYFLSIYVNTDVMYDYCTILAKKMKKYFDKYPAQPKDWTFTDVIDVESVKHTKARMFGTVKFRRGNEIPRKYSFAGIFANKTGDLNEQATNYLKQKDNCEALCRLSSVRLEEEHIVTQAKSAPAAVLDSVVIEGNNNKHREKIALYGIPVAVLLAEATQ